MNISSPIAIRVIKRIEKIMVDFSGKLYFLLKKAETPNAISIPLTACWLSRIFTKYKMIEKIPKTRKRLET